jgi:hypothetical protein
VLAQHCSASHSNLTRKRPVTISRAAVTATWGPPISALSSLKFPAQPPRVTGGTDSGRCHPHPITWSLPSLPATPPMRTVGSSCTLTQRGATSPCCIGRPLSRPLRRHDASAKHPVTRPRAASLLPPPLLAPCVAPSILQLPSPAPGRNYAVARPCAPRGHHQPLPVQLTTPTPAYGENSHPSRALHGAIAAVLPPMLPHLSSDCAGI